MGLGRFTLVSMTIGPLESALHFNLSILGVAGVR